MIGVVCFNQLNFKTQFEPEAIYNRYINYIELPRATPGAACARGTVQRLRPQPGSGCPWHGRPHLSQAPGNKWLGNSKDEPTQEVDERFLNESVEKNVDVVEVGDGEESTGFEWFGEVVGSVVAVV